MRAPPVDIFVWGMHPHTSTEDIVIDLAECGIVIEKKDALKKSKDEAPLLSFKISVRAEDLSKALDPSIWSLRVKVREYIYYLKKKQEENSAKNENVPQQQTQQQSHLSVPISSSSSIPVTLSNRFSPLAGVQNLAQK